MLGMSWVAAQLAASQEGLSTMSEWVSVHGGERHKTECGSCAGIYILTEIIIYIAVSFLATILNVQPSLTLAVTFTSLMTSQYSTLGRVIDITSDQGWGYFFSTVCLKMKSEPPTKLLDIPDTRFFKWMLYIFASEWCKHEVKGILSHHLCSFLVFLVFYKNRSLSGLSYDLLNFGSKFYSMFVCPVKIVILILILSSVLTIFTFYNWTAEQCSIMSHNFLPLINHSHHEYNRRNVTHYNISGKPHIAIMSPYLQPYFIIGTVTQKCSIKRQFVLS
jgi:hypothetical protein